MKTMQHHFEGKEPDIHFEVLKLEKKKKPTPQRTQYAILTLRRHVYDILLI